MTLLSILIIAIALSVDAFSVALTIGMCNNCLSRYHKFRYFTIIGIFHIFMMLAGWYMGSYLVTFLDGYSHWVSFLLIEVLGVKMIIDGFSIVKGKTTDQITNYTTLSKTLMFGVALSLDAVVAGVTISAEKISIIQDQSQFVNAIIASVITGVVVFFITWFGLRIGRKTGEFIGKYSVIIGGGILIIMGINIALKYII